MGNKSPAGAGLKDASDKDAKRYEPLVGARVRAVQQTNGLGSRTAHGDGTAFSAVAPSKRPVLPSIDPIFGSGIPPGPNSLPTFRPLIRFRLCRFLIRIAYSV